MKITNKILVLLMGTLLSLGFTGCGDDDDKGGNPKTEETPDFVIEQESVRMKIGPENKVTLNINGGGEYNAFSLDENIAKTEVINDMIIIEGLVNGKTSLIISDKYNRYRRLPVSVYTVEVIELNRKDFSVETLFGSSEIITANVTAGNGGYKAESNHPAVKVSVSEDGEINVTAISQESDYTATVTITDCTGLSENITVSVKAHFNAFTNEELEAIMNDNSRLYFYKNSNTYFDYYDFVNETLDNGKQRYGWNHWNFIWFYLDFKGDKSTGRKDDAQLHYISFYDEITTPVILEIIKNDGTNIWGIYFYGSHKGYFCDTVDP